VQYSGREIVADDELKIVLESVTSKPQKQTAYATYNSGYLEYKITPSTTQVEIKNISFTVDELVYYGSDKVLTGAIIITSLIDGQQTNELVMDIKQSNTPATTWYIDYKSGDPISKVQLTGKQLQTPVIAYTKY
jgi:CRISPR/Cas system endoribonuclease Cas6 (RAMP superfamily)